VGSLDQSSSSAQRIEIFVFNTSMLINSLRYVDYFPFVNNRNLHDCFDMIYVFCDIGEGVAR